MTLTDEQKTAARNTYADALARSDDGIGSLDQQARDKRIIDKFEASALADEYGDWEIAQWNAAIPAHTVEVGQEDGAWWWTCSWGREEGGYDTEDDARADADGRQHDEPERD